MTSKTPGEIAVDARQRYRLDNDWHKSRCYGWDDLMEDERQSEEAAASAIIEQCAKLIDEQAHDAFDNATTSFDAMTIDLYNTLVNELHAAAARIRSLKSPKEQA